ncbi:MAG: GNAT family N-acetyltransferase [Bacteroidia bacterium]
MLTVNFDPFPEIHTDRLTLRRMTTADLPRLFKLRNDPQIIQNTDRPSSSDMSAVEALFNRMDQGINRNENITWGITFAQQSELIGTSGFWRIDFAHHRAEIGYELLPEHWNKGIMTEALRAMLACGFSKMKIHSVEANINPKNESSRAVLLKCGFVKEAYFRENYYANGQFLDSEIYSLLERDLRKS